MQSICLLCVGTLKERYLKEGCAEYEKRLSPFCKLSVQELPEAKLYDESKSAVQAALSKEGKAFLEKLPGRYNIALCVEGERVTSPQLAQRLERAALAGQSRISFLIGGSWGLSEEVKRQCQMRLSLSDLTLPHQLCRLLLLEQLYRAQTIRNGIAYHK